MSLDSDPIKHVIVLMFENHSFDQMLGCFKEVYPGLDGIDPANLRQNRDSAGRSYTQAPSNQSTISPDPKHELHNVRDQLSADGGGFVADYERSYPATTTDQRQEIMNYYPVGFLPAMHELGQHFMICDHWFSSVPGPTWTNRFFLLSGTSKGLVSMPESGFDIGSSWMFLHYDQDTIFDRLNDQGVYWRVYYGDIPQSLALTHQRRPANAWRYYRLSNFFADAEEQEHTFPEFSLIEPNYMFGDQNDDHPPHSTMRAQRLLGQIYNAVRKNEGLWNSTVLIVLYDEHGGFYDHVAPPAAMPPDSHADEYSFDQLGVRVPAMLISPWVDRGVVSTHFDHTSLIRYLCHKWNLDPLRDRDRQAASVGMAIRASGSPRQDTPTEVPVPAGVGMALAAADLPFGAANDVTAEEIAETPNDLQRSLIALTEHIEATELPQRMRAMVAAPGPVGETQLAKERIEEFFRVKGRQFH